MAYTMNLPRPLVLLVALASAVAARDLTAVGGGAAASYPADVSLEEADARPMHIRGAGPQRPQPTLQKKIGTMGGGQKMNGGMQKRNQIQQQQQRSPTGTTPQDANDDDETKQNFDFVVAGFPKCGTTTLLKAFGAHEETDMAPQEVCSIAAPKQADMRVLRSLDNTLASLQTGENMKHSFKCPTAMYNYKSITRMEKHSPEAKYVIGMRHPVEMLQSFYNYRITEIKERGLDESTIKTLEDILDSGKPWKGVSLQATRFELFLMQLGKTSVTAEELDDLVNHDYDLAISPTMANVFLYTTDQLEDTNEKRSQAFREEMQQFLGLKKPIAPFGRENKNHLVHEESINICDEKWSTLRAKLVQQGAETARWLEEQFIKSNDVSVANREHFIESLSSWSTDPCVGISATA